MLFSIPCLHENRAKILGESKLEPTSLRQNPEILRDATLKKSNFFVNVFF
jgi:hypothetical protein